MRGRIIQFEGPDGSGKGTQRDLAHTSLRQMFPDRDLVDSAEPWDGDETHAVIRGSLDPDLPHITIDPHVLQWIFTLNRRAHHERLLIPERNRGSIILQDRSWVSTITYLTATSNRSYEEARDWVIKEHQRLLGESWEMPDMILVFLVSPEEALKRMEARGIKLESFDANLDLQRRVYEAYQQFIADSVFDVPRVAIDGERDKEVVCLDVMAAIGKTLETSDA